MGPGSGDGVQEFLVVPSARNPRMLLPTGRAAASAALGNTGRSPNRRQRARDGVLASVLATPGGTALFRDRLVAPRRPGDGGLKDTVDRLVGVDAAWAMPVSRARANRKPVVQVMDSTGAPVAFVKVATNDLTRRLLLTEAAALFALRERTNLVNLPRVIATQEWRGLGLLVLAPLPLQGATAPPVDQALRGASDIAESHGRWSRPLAGSSYLTRLRARLGELAGPRAAELAEVCRELDLETPGQLDFGAWHGDWAPWNMAWAGGRLHVFDLERFEVDVPVGLDLVHADLQTRILDPGRDPSSVIAERLRNAPTLLAPLGLSPSASRLVFTLYLVEIACRWEEDRQDLAGGWGSVLDAMVRGARESSRRALAEVVP